MSDNSDDDGDDEGNVIELRPARTFPDARDEGSTLTVVAPGAILKFPQPPTRAKDVSDPLPQRVRVLKERRWEWVPSEIEVGFSVRHSHDGKHIIIALENPGDPPTCYEAWLPLETVQDRGGGRHEAGLLQRLYPVVNSAHDTIEEARRSDGTREVVAEALGRDGPWKLVRGTKPRGEGKRDEVWWEVTGGKSPMRIHDGYDAERDARRDFDQHKPPWRCGLHRSGLASHDRTPWGSGWSWSQARDGDPCIRKDGHPGAHRNRNGEEWSTWPRVQPVALPLTATKQRGRDA